MVLTNCECLLLLCCGIAVGLFCWLSYASLSAARLRRTAPARDSHLPQATAADDRGSVGAAIPG